MNIDEFWTCADCSKGLTINELFEVNNNYYCRTHYIIHSNERMMIEDMARRGRPPLVGRQQPEQKPAVKIAQADAHDALRYIVNKGEVIVPEPFDVELEAEYIGEVYNEPEHYHKHDIDTIEFLQKGFPPEVFMGFALGHIVKYAQRANYKNGREDYVKMVDYAKRALEWYDKTNPSE